MTYDFRSYNFRLGSWYLLLPLEFGQWYAEIFDFKTESIKILRCGKILSITEINDKIPKNLEELLSGLDAAFHQGPAAIEFTVLVYQNGKVFTKENYPSMKIKKENENYVITGYFNKTELTFIAS